MAPVPSASNSVQENNQQVEWKRGSLLGRGSFGSVFVAFDVLRGNLLAVKQVNLRTHCPQQSQQIEAAVHREISLLRRVQHPNLVRLVGVNIHVEVVEIVMEYAPGGTITDLLSTYGSFTEQLCKSYMRQLVAGIMYLHDECEIVHRDVKGSNILVCLDGLVKLADFGCAAHVNDCKGRVGTTPYMAPEVARGTSHNGKADVWSAGCCLLEMLQGNPPWHGRFKYDISALYHIARTAETPQLEHLVA
jgi:serine/threonine protein kinase